MPIPPRLRAPGVLMAMLVAALAIPSPNAGAARHPTEDETGSFALLKTLLETPGVSTREERVRDLIKTLLPGWAKAEVDKKGNLLVVAGPERASKSLLFIAHMDETGYLVAGVREDGMLQVRPVGGFFPTLYEGQVVLIRTTRGDVGGVIPPRSGYFAGSEAPDAFGGEALRVDVGTRDRAGSEALGVAPGDPVTIPKQFLRLAGSFGAGRAVDDRAGCTALLLALRRLDPERLRHRVTFAFSVEEEIGLEGARALAETLRPDVAIGVDTFVSSDSPLERPAFARAILGNGPVIRAIDSSNITDRPLVDRVLALAREAGLPIQYGLTRGGNDGSVFPPLGVPNLAISWPTVNSHSPVEVIHEGDLDGLARLVQLIAERW